MRNGFSVIGMLVIIQAPANCPQGYDLLSKAFPLLNF
jgi:hypothetical protein